MENLDEVMEAAEKASIRTSQGSFLRVDDLREILHEKTKETEAMRQAQPKPRTMNEAKQQAMRDPELREKLAGSGRMQEPRRAVQADS